MNGWEVFFCALVTLLALSPLLVFRRSLHLLKWMIGLSVLGLALTSAVAWNSPQDHAAEVDLYLPKQASQDEYVTSKSCRSCHPKLYDTWHATYHRTMTQPATPNTVLAPFDNIQFQLHGKSYHLKRQGNQYWTWMPDPDWEAVQSELGVDVRMISDPPMVQRQVVLTTGSHHTQEYWIPSQLGGNELHQFPFVYRIAEKQWIPRDAAFLRPPGEPQYFPSWNQNCLPCHSTGGVPGADPRTAQLNSSVAEFGIACEACHGPGRKHIARHQNPLRRYRGHIAGDADSAIINPARCSAEVSSQICGQCHSYSRPRNLNDYGINGARYRPGDDLEKTCRLLRYGDDRDDAPHWPDGSIRVGGREYHGLIESPCYESGKFSCLSCHSMHHSDPNDQLADGRDGNQACTQCHAESRFRQQVERHTHHSAGSRGSLCYNCHMPHTSYAVLSATRSHRIDSPSAAASVHTGRPNACNLCHLDQTLGWTAKYLSGWYGIEEDIELNDFQQTTAASLLWLLKGDAAQRAVTAWHFGWNPAHQASGNQWQAPFLAQLLDDSYAAVRFVADRALCRLPGFDKFEYDITWPKQRRAQARQRVLDKWNRDRILGSNRNRVQLLLGPDGVLRQQDVERLLQAREDPPIHISE